MKELSSLPELEPRWELEPKTLAAMANEADALMAHRRTRRFLAKAAAWIAVIGTGSLLAILAANLEGPVEQDEPLTIANENLVRLFEEAARQEQVLALLPEPRRVMRADTASTIVGLEDSITLIDAALYSSEDADPLYREALMRDRVEAMNALINVRYAQSRAFIF